MATRFIHSWRPPAGGFRTRVLGRCRAAGRGAAAASGRPRRRRCAQRRGGRRYRSRAGTAWRQSRRACRCAGLPVGRRGSRRARGRARGGRRPSAHSSPPPPRARISRSCGTSTGSPRTRSLRCRCGSCSNCPDGAAIVRFGQAVDGVEVFREYANVLLDRERELVAVGGSAGGGAVGRSEARARATARSRACGRGGARRTGLPGCDRRIAAAGGLPPTVTFALPCRAAVRGDDGSELVDPVRAKGVWFRDRGRPRPRVLPRDAGARRRLAARPSTTTPT